ncbi:MAG: ydgI [Bacteroidetes bacterium]|nr:ydgI [Bacteroidota bacterium]
MQTFYELAQKRQSDRTYESRPVENAKLDRILEAARLSPSACNGQPWKVIVVDDPELKNKVADATSNKVVGINHFTKQASVHLVVVEERTNLSSRIGGWMKRKHFSSIDLGILASHITLAAADEGLGSCIIGWLDEKKIKTLLHIPSSKRVPFLILLGYTTASHRDKIRKPLTDIVSHNGY